MIVNHDQYLKFTPHNVLDETLIFHSKGNYTLHEATRHLSTLHHIPEMDLKNLTGNELKLDTLGTEHHGNIPPLPAPHPLRRLDSCEHFKSRMITFESVINLLRPLVSKENTHKRGYPSGGALYPIEVFCVNLNNSIKNWPSESGALHLLPKSRTLEVHSPKINCANLSRAIAPLVNDIGTPTLALIYFIYIPKSLFKYRYRGYRLALMETGSMYMLVDLCCKENHFRSRPWSGFTDHQVTKELHLNPSLFLPACIQLIG